MLDAISRGSPWSLVALVHGGVGLTLLLSAVFVHERLRSVTAEQVPGVLRWLAAVALFAAALVTLGVRLYARYRTPGNARDWLLAHAPALHTIGMEWKEYAGPLLVPAAVCAWLLARTLGPRLAHDPEARGAVRACLAVAIAIALLGFILGTLISRVHPVV